MLLPTHQERFIGRCNCRCWPVLSCRFWVKEIWAKAIINHMRRAFTRYPNRNLKFTIGDRLILCHTPACNPTNLIMSSQICTLQTNISGQFCKDGIEIFSLQFQWATITLCMKKPRSEMFCSKMCQKFAGLLAAIHHGCRRSHVIHLESVHCWAPPPREGGPRTGEIVFITRAWILV